MPQTATPSDRFEVRTCTGLATGNVFQFSEQHWKSPNLGGIAISEEAFDLVEPILLRAWPEWPIGARYGESELQSDVIQRFVQELKEAALIQGAARPEGRLFSEIAQWIEAASARAPTIHLLGL